MLESNNTIRVVSDIHESSHSWEYSPGDPLFYPPYVDFVGMITSFAPVIFTMATRGRLQHDNKYKYGS